MWLNQGGEGGTAGSFTDSGQTLGNHASRGVSLGDVDGDGDLDAFVANYNQPNRVWLNQGGAQGGTAGSFTDSGQTLGNHEQLRRVAGRRGRRRRPGRLRRQFQSGEPGVAEPGGAQGGTAGSSPTAARRSGDHRS